MDASFHAFCKHLIMLNLFRFENCSCLYDSLIAHITKIPISSKIKKWITHNLNHLALDSYHF